MDFVPLVDNLDQGGTKRIDRGPDARTHFVHGCGRHAQALADRGAFGHRIDFVKIVAKVVNAFQKITQAAIQRVKGSLRLRTTQFNCTHNAQLLFKG